MKTKTYAFITLVILISATFTLSLCYVYIDQPYTISVSWGQEGTFVKPYIFKDAFFTCTYLLIGYVAVLLAYLIITKLKSIKTGSV